MAKKRKLHPKSTNDSTATQPKKQQKKKPEQEQPQQPPPPVEPEHIQSEQQEDEEVEESEEEQEQEQEQEEGDDEDDDDEPIEKLLEPFNKDQLISLLSKAAESHSDVLSQVKKLADVDPVHRKIFVHGLGWDATSETLISAFSQYGEIEDCKAVIDKITGKSKGYGFILFKSRAGAYKALKEPQKKIGTRLTSCQLAAVGPGPGPGQAQGVVQQQQQQPVSEYTQRKIFVSNVSADMDPQKITSFFSKFGEIEDGPLGLDKQSGKFKGFCLFVYKSVEGAKKALEEPHKPYEGHVLHCQRAVDGIKQGKQQYQNRGQSYGRKDGNPSVGGGGGMGQSGVGYNQAGASATGLNPALGQALTALLASQGAGLGLNNLLGSLGGGIGATSVAQGGYGSQGVAGSGIAPGGVMGGYAAQGGLQSAYPNQQMGQGASGRSQHGHLGGLPPYSGH